MREKFEKELDLHVNLIEINDVKITALDEKFTKELAVQSNLIGVNDKKISTLGDEARLTGIKLMHLESTPAPVMDKYFLENDYKIGSFMESIEIINKNIKDLKTNLAYAYARIVILEDKTGEGK